MRKPARLSADQIGTTPGTLTEEVLRLRPGAAAMKEAHLLALVTRTFTKRVIIFSRTKQQAHRLKIILGLSGIRAAELHGDLTQTMRLAALEEFRVGDASISSPPTSPRAVSTSAAWTRWCRTTPSNAGVVSSPRGSHGARWKEGHRVHVHGGIGSQVDQGGEQARVETRRARGAAARGGRVPRQGGGHVGTDQGGGVRGARGEAPPEGGDGGDQG